MRPSIRFGCALTLLWIVPADADDPKPREDEKTIKAKAVDDQSRPNTFVGLYRISSGEDSGEVIPVEEIRDHTVRIDEDLITVMDQDETKLYVCHYTLKTDHTPILIDMKTTGGPPEARGQTARGIIKRDEQGRVILCYQTVGDEYPKDFRTRVGAEQNMFVLEPIEAETSPR